MSKPVFKWSPQPPAGIFGQEDTERWFGRVDTTEPESPECFYTSLYRYPDGAKIDFYQGLADVKDPDRAIRVGDKVLHW